MRLTETRTAGFTLIELLVVVSVMLITLGGSIAAYIDFNERQLLLESGKTIENALETARAMARTSNTPDDCLTLTGYEVTGIAGLSETVTYALCEDGVNEKVEVSGSQWDDGVKLTSDFSTVFYTLHGGAQPVAIELNKGGEIYRVEVGTGGNIWGQLVQPGQGPL